MGCRKFPAIRRFLGAIAAVIAISVWVAGLQGPAFAQPPSDAAPPPTPEKPCLMVVEGVVTQREAFRAYAAALPPLYERFGGAYLAISRAPEVLEGAIDYESLVVSRWPSCAAARAFWTSPEYRRLVELRRDWGTFRVVIVEGFAETTTVPPLARPGAP